ncbi:MAG TPA: BREX-1 system phosphatase PglZ type A, partial [Anaerolineales bacterium]|nr:BREX-1 system phosphatase PglZ type A [Anaerolineales bacterium]
MENIAQHITRQFEKHRIVFWYDEKKELREAFESLMLPGVETIELKNNEYGVKYTILREKPNQKFLLYHEGPQPEDLNNWLLDVLLANGVFNANQEALWANEIGLQANLFDLVTGHTEFFRDEKRRSALKARYKQDDSRSMVQVRMLAVCAKAEVEDRVESVVESLLDELAQGRQEKIALIQRCNLDGFLWGKLKAQFDYVSTKPGVKDFAITLFKNCYQLSVEETPSANQDALVFLKRWRDNVRYQEAFEKLSEEYKDILGIERDLEKRDFRNLIEVDFFRLIDQRILSELAQQIYNQTISAGDCANLIWRRRTTHWYR